MKKKKISIDKKIAIWIVSHPWLKLVALALAIMVWFYAKIEIKRFNTF